MNPLPILFSVALLAEAVLLADSAYAATTNRMQPAAGETPNSTTTLELHFDNGLIDAYIDGIPLAKVLHELALKAGIQIKLNDPEVANSPVSVALKAIPLEQGLKNILDSFSYALYRVYNAPTVIVLSTQPRSSNKGLRTIGVGFAPIHLTNEPDPQPPTPTSGEEVPRSLDEFQPLTTEEDDQNTDPSAQLAQEQEYKEALLRRALDVLKSEHKHLHMEALDQLAGIEDPRATQALVEAVSSSTTLDPKLRLHAASALWQHAESQHFADATSANTLKQLAEDSDENIRSLAREALRHMESSQNSAQ